MIHDNQILDKIDPEDVKSYTKALVKEHRMSGRTNPSYIGYSLDKPAGLASAKITAKKLAEATGKKFYYKVINHINELLDEH
jgi:hypothetical protein